jgi:hypothetical protein
MACLAQRAAQAFGEELGPAADERHLHTGDQDSHEAI